MKQGGSPCSDFLSCLKSSMAFACAQGGIRCSCQLSGSNSKVSADDPGRLLQALNLSTHRSIIGRSTAQQMIRTVVLIHLGVISSGRCEKIDLETWSNFGLEKSRARMPYKRPLGLRHTFRFRRNFSEIDFFTSSRRNNPLMDDRPFNSSASDSRRSSNSLRSYFVPHLPRREVCTACQASRAASPGAIPACLCFPCRPSISRYPLSSSCCRPATSTCGLRK